MKTEELDYSEFLGTRMNSFQMMLDKDICQALEAEFILFKRSYQQRCSFSNPALAYLWDKIQHYHYCYLSGESQHEMQSRLAFCLDQMSSIVIDQSARNESYILPELAKIIGLWPKARLRAKGIRLLYLILRQSVTPRILQLESALIRLDQSTANKQDVSSIDLWSQVYLILCYAHALLPADARHHFNQVALIYKDHRDAAFFHASIIEQAKTDVQISKIFENAFQQYRTHPSAYVRIRNYEYLLTQSIQTGSWFTFIASLESEPDPQVKVAAIAQSLPKLFLPHMAKESSHVAPIFFEYLAKQKDDVTCKAWLKSLQRQLSLALRKGPEYWEVISYYKRSLESLVQSAELHQVTVIQRLASRLRFGLTIFENPKILVELRQFVRNLDSGAKQWPFQLGDEIDPDQFWSAVSFISTDHAPLDIQLKADGCMHVFRDLYFSFSWWRLIFEIKHPSGVKRQTISHWQSRNFRGHIRVPSQAYCELVETTVPGEPLYIPEEESWRPWLPLACDAYRLLWKSSARLSIYSPYGLTILQRPKGLFRRFWSWLRYLVRYKEIAKLRNWRTGSFYPAHGYIKRLRQLGFQISFRAHCRDKKDLDHISCFFQEHDGKIRK